MADELGTPVVDAPASSASTDSGAAPSSAAPSTPAPVTTPDSGERQPGQSQSEFLRSAVDKAVANAETQMTKPAAPPVAEPAKPEVPAPKVGETKPAEAAAAKPPEATAAVPNPLDKVGALPAEKIAAALTAAPPEVKEYLEKNGLTLDALAENARQAAEGSQFKEIFPTIDAAKTALDGAQNFWKLDNGLPAVKTAEDFNKFMMDTLVQMSYIRDEAGNPIPNPDIPGAFKTDGSVDKLIHYSAAVRDAKIVELADEMVKAATTDEDKSYASDLGSAMKFVNDFIKNGFKAPASGEPTKLPPDVQARLDEADRLKLQISQRDQQASTQAFEAQETKIEDLSYKELSPIAMQILNGTALPDGVKTMVFEQAIKKVVAGLEKNALYTRQRDQMSPTAKDYEQRRVALNLTYGKPVLVKAIEEVVGMVGGPVVDANKARHDKLDAQTAASRMEPRTSGTTPQAHPAQLSVDDIHTKALEMARKENNNPNIQAGSREYFQAIQKLRGLPLSA